MKRIFDQPHIHDFYKAYSCIIKVMLFQTLNILILASGAFAGSIYLRSGTINTDAAVKPASIFQQKNLGSGYYIVEMNGPVTESDKASIVSAGAEIIEYVPDNAFIIHARHKNASNIKKLSCVHWVSPFKPEYKKAAALRDIGTVSQIIVKLFPGNDPDFVLSKGKRLGAKKITCEKKNGGSVCRMLASKSQIAALADLDAVAYIEPYVQPKLCNDVASGISGVPELRSGLGLYGTGQIIGVADSGLDTGNMSTMSADFSGRILSTYAIRRSGDWSDPNGHGTHVTGSVLGSGALSGSNPSAHNYTGSFAGYAPEAELVCQSIGDSGDYVFPPLHLSDLFQPAYEDGARVHSDSWGSSVYGEYTVYSNEVDQFIWDHKDFTAVFAVGNDGVDANNNGIIDTGCIYAPATAKNCISIGATENLRSVGGYQSGYGVLWATDYSAAPIKYDLISNNICGMAAFSGRGPTKDGRVKPDICAPGTNIISSRSHVRDADTGWAVYDDNYIYWGGTSMATPQVAGAAALVRQFYEQEKSIQPSAALVKATLINGAVDISPGQYGTGQWCEVQPVPDYSQGWGRMNLKNSLFPDPPVVNEFADETSAISTGDYREYKYNVIDTTISFRATLVWSDYPGSVNASKELVNDLDLMVISPSGTAYTVINHLDNIEQVTLSAPEAGVYTVRVTGYNVPMGPQDYALVVSGGLPSTYIAGTVTSESGAPVQGAMVTFVYSNGSKHITTNSSGRFISHVEPGLYSVKIAKTGWTFTPRARLIKMESTPIDGVNFQGTGTPGSISGRVGSSVGGVVSHIVETSHPYLNNMNQVYTVKAYDQATRMRVHFAEIDLMNDGDTIYILDEGDNIKDVFTGKGEDVWSSWVDGNSIQIWIVTNSFGNIGYGFYADGYETDLIDQGGLAGATVTLSPGDFNATTTENGSYNFPSVPPGTYTVSPVKAHWKFQPVTKTVEIPSGDSVSDIDFQGFPPGSIDGTVQIATSTTQPLDIQTPHPYTSYYDETWEIDADPSTTRMRLHFSNLETEPAWDWLYVIDANDNIVESYTDVATDFWSPWIEGNVAKIQFTSDNQLNYYGFKCDKYEAQVVHGGLAGIRIDLSPDSRNTITTSSGSFILPDVDVGDHAVTPVTDLWTFDPASIDVNIAAGIDQHLTFYAKAIDMSSAVQAKSMADGVEVSLVNMVVSAVFNGFFYIEDRQRTNGLCVVSSQIVQIGDVVNVTGIMTTVNGERRINASGVTR